MKRSTKIISVVLLSFGIIGGVFAYAKHKYRDPAVFAEHIVEHISDELTLDDAQQQALSTLKDTVLESRQKMRDQVKPLPDEIINLLSADTFDQTKALEIVNNKTATINASAPEVIAALGNFMDGLNAEQKSEVLEFVKHKVEHRRHYHNH